MGFFSKKEKTDAIKNIEATHSNDLICFTAKVDRLLARRFKALCSTNGVTMKDVIEDYMKDAVSGYYPDDTTMTRAWRLEFPRKGW